MPRTSAGPSGTTPLKREQALVAPLDAVALPATVVGGQHHRADDRVEARGVAAAGGDGDAHQLAPLPPPAISLDDLSRLRVPPQRLLGEDQLAVHLDLEHAARRRDQPDVGVRKGLLQLGRQTWRPGARSFRRRNTGSSRASRTLRRGWAAANRSASRGAMPRGTDRL